jgi:hypothetical protein
MATEKAEEIVEGENPKIIVEIIDGHPEVTMVNWEVFNNRLMQRVNRAISRQRMRLRRTAVKEARRD